MCNGAKIFSGGSKYNRSMKIFNESIEENKDTLSSLGIHLVDLVSHQNQKGSATMDAVGCKFTPQL